VLGQKTKTTIKGQKMKFIIRRFILAVILSPVVAGAYFLFYASLVGLGAQPTTDVAGAWGNGWLHAIVLGLMFTFSTQVWAWAMKEGK
jgi:hypothetical protein